ncbi:unannotated protein [freshwater metagenome]|uniref:Unannotated protein n=1 Tax=freshwater metagenome TaxID=449393 RepID=A0A6J7R2N0_9ZZZZ
MIAVHRGGHSHLCEPGGHELQKGHLRGGVLHGDTIGAQVGVGLGAFEALALGIFEVVHQDLLGQGKPAAEAAAPDRHALAELGVDGCDQLDRGVRSDGHVRSSECRLAAEMMPRDRGGRLAGGAGTAGRSIKYYTSI